MEKYTIQAVLPKFMPETSYDSQLLLCSSRQLFARGVMLWQSERKFTSNKFLQKKPADQLNQETGLGKSIKNVINSRITCKKKAWPEVRHFLHYNPRKTCDFHSSHTPGQSARRNATIKAIHHLRFWNPLSIFYLGVVYVKFWGTLSVRNVEEFSMNPMLETPFCQLYYIPLKHFVAGIAHSTQGKSLVLLAKYLHTTCICQRKLPLCPYTGYCQQRVDKIWLTKTTCPQNHF